MNKLTVEEEKNKPKKKKKPINIQRLLVVVTVAACFAIQLWSAFKESSITSADISYEQFIQLEKENKIKNVVVIKTKPLMTVTETDGKVVTVINPQNDTFIRDLLNKGIKVSVQKTTLFESVSAVIVSLPLMIFAVMLLVYMSNTIAGGNISKFTLVKPGLNHVKFDDVRGMTGTKQEVQFIIDQLKNWKAIGDLGARSCKGLLLYGPPGTGKTLLAKAIANEAGVAFISASGSDFAEMFVGVGAARVRALWDLALTASPCIIFIDEIDCLGKRRTGFGNNENNQTLNALLQRMDGLNPGSGVLVIGATNRLEDLDTALTRPGRFDRHYYIGAPDNKADRDSLVELYTKTKKLADGVTTENISRLMVGMTGADIEQALNEAVFISLQKGRDGKIEYSDIDEAIMESLSGGVKSTHTSDRDKEITAYHEAGHTLVSLLLNIPVAKVSIIPYTSGIGGVTMRDLDKIGDNKLRLESEVYSDIKIDLAGKVAEDIIYKEHTQGCSQDISQASKEIYNAITSYGYSNSKLLNTKAVVDNDTFAGIDKDTEKECNKRLEKLEHEVELLLNNNLEKLKKLEALLIEKETIVNPTLSMLE